MDEKRSKATRNCTFRMTNKNWSCQMSCLAIYGHVWPRSWRHSHTKATISQHFWFNRIHTKIIYWLKTSKAAWAHTKCITVITRKTVEAVFGFPGLYIICVMYLVHICIFSECCITRPPLEQKTDVCPFFGWKAKPGNFHSIPKYMFFFFQSKALLEFIYILIPTKLGIEFQKLR